LPTDTFFNLDKQKQNRVIKAAVNEFAQNGYTKGSITKIVENAEIPESNKERLKKMLTELFENGDMFLDFCW